MKRSASTNTFTEGLVMDLNPLLTPSTVLTDALNATLITNNGNDNVLQNDMGNGRVGTAFLPEGYIPVGTCEFGDIIYVASYNPIINKCQLGCFPSPQRYHVNDSETDLKQSLSDNEFHDIITGKIKLNTLKKIVYENNLQSGDKYIISASDISSENYLSDLGNEDYITGLFPRLYKITVISIEEDGKFTDLTSGVKWYNPSKPYYLSKDKVTIKDDKQIDIDEYRTAVTSPYCIFSSKVSGKLALLIELESITGFSCTWDIGTVSNGEGDIIETTYPINFLINWESEDNNISPSHIILTKGEFKDSIYKYTLNEGELKLDDLKLEVNLELPKPWSKEDEKKEIKYDSDCYNAEITRSYIPENTSDYNSFKEKNYSTELNKYLDNYKQKRDEKNLKYSNPLTLKFIEEGTYYENLCKIDKNEQGKLIYSDNYGNELEPVLINDDIVNNYFLYPIKKHFHDFTIPTLQIIKGENDVEQKIDLKLDGTIYEYTVAPCMPYGVLELYALKGIIDFSKINRKLINLNTWKYYNQEGYSTLTWGLEAYTEPNKVISKVTMEFFDNKGYIASMHFSDKMSYNGTFTNYIPFNSSNSNMNNIRYDGTPVNREENGFDISGKIQSNSLYLVKIYVDYASVSALGTPIDPVPEIFYRWYWTSKQFNDVYFLIDDFNNAQFNLSPNADLKFSTTTEWQKNWKTEQNYIDESGNIKEYAISPGSIDEKIEVGKTTKPLSFSAIKQSEFGEEGNIKVDINLSLQNNWEVFDLASNIDDSEKKLVGKLYLGKEKISNSPEQPKVLFSDKGCEVYEGIMPVNKNYKECTDKSNSEYINYYDLNFVKLKGTETLKYYDFEKELEEELSSLYVDIYEDHNLNFNFEHYSKYYFTNIEKGHNAKVLKAFIKEESDCRNYNLNDNHLFAVALGIGATDTSGQGVWVEFYVINDPMTQGNCNYQGIYNSKQDESVNINYAFNNIEKGNDTLIKSFNFIFPYCFMHSDRGGDLINPTQYNGQLTYLTNFKVLNDKKLEKGTTSNVGNPSSYAIGGLGCISMDEKLVLTDLKSDKVTTATSRFPDSFGKMIYEFLTHCFYISDNTEYINSLVVDNVVYLEPNYAEYSRDLILKLFAYEGQENEEETKEFGDIYLNKDTNSLIYFNNLLYSKYLEEVIKNSSENAIPDYINKSPHVYLKLNSYQGTFPLVFNINYVTPDLDLYFADKVEVQCIDSIKKDVSKAAFNKLFTRNKIYCFTTAIENGIEVKEVRDLTNTATFVDATGRKFKATDSFIRLLTIDEGKMKLKSNVTGSSSYFVKVHKDGKEHSKSIKGFAKDVKFFENV